MRKNPGKIFVPGFFFSHPKSRGHWETVRPPSAKPPLPIWSRGTTYSIEHFLTSTNDERLAAAAVIQSFSSTSSPSQYVFPFVATDPRPRRRLCTLPYQAAGTNRTLLQTPHSTTPCLPTENERPTTMSTCPAHRRPPPPPRTASCPGP